MKNTSALGSLAVLFLAVSTTALTAQVVVGIPPFQSFGGGPDVINLGNLNVHYSLPVFGRAGRGIPFSYALAYDSSVWQSAGSAWLFSGGGLTRDVPAAVGVVSATWRQASCINHYDGSRVYYDLYTYTGYSDSAGTLHRLPYTVVNDDDGTCLGGSGGPHSATIVLSDGSGMTVGVNDAPSAGVALRDGRKIAPVLRITNNTSSSQSDSNGNEITSSTTSGVTSFYDTLSSTTAVMTISGVFPSPVSYKYTAPSGVQAAVVVSFKSYLIQTNFGCSGINEYGPLSNSLPDKITLADGSFYQFFYEKTPISGNTNVTGRIASIQLPTGGTISYNYQGYGNNGIICTDGSTAGFTRTTPDGTWTYSRSGASPVYTTTITDPQSNVTVINFNGNFETQRQIYQGAATGTPLETILTCYNGNTTNCASATVTSPFNEINVYRQFNGGQQARIDTFYDTTYSLVQESDEYDFGATVPTRKTTTSYGSYNSSTGTCTALGNGIVDHPCLITVTDGSGNLKSKTGYAYDESGVTSTTGTPNHGTVTGSRGNPTTVTTYVTATKTLTKTATYYDTGTANTTKDVNNAQTTYSYGAASCGNSFPTSVTFVPLSLSESMTWNCTGGVLTSSTDENSQTSYKTYTTDPYFWRPESTKDQLGNLTSLSYASLTQSRGHMDFNGSTSTVDVTNTLDSLGRALYSQRKQGQSSGNYDTVQQTYDSFGRPFQETVPYLATTTTNPTPPPGAPATTTTYDALGRVLTVTDSSGGQLSYTYINNDVLQTVSGGQSFQKQFEYDGLGRLTSVCEISSTLSGVGTCGQANSKTGYWTKYTYDALGRLLNVTQNAQAASTSQQTRSFSYDWLSRMTSETNPESGTKTYVYDTSSAPCNGGGPVTFNGDLIMVTDAAGNCALYFYDALHRVTDVGNNKQSATNPCRRFRYDNSSGYSGSTKPAGLVNTLGRLIEAATDSCISGSNDALLTDEWFSYGPRGKLADIYESTPSSGGYYHSNASYAANFALSSLSLYNSSGAALIPTLTYTLDGEGRPSAVSAASGQNPVTSVTYSTGTSTSPLGALTGVTFGSGDSDNFQYDPNTGRMTQYSFNVNSQSAVGKLTWHPNGTLQTLAITDPFNSQDNQSCAYNYDDLSRVSGINCGSVWAQTFNFDPFGNVAKSGSISWQPTYNGPANNHSSNNQYLTGWNGVSYDASGDLLNDTFNTYTWDVYGDLASTNGATVTNDAFGRMVENKSRGFEFVYSPADGSVLAAIQGQNIVNAYVPLPGGATASYTAAGLVNYFHADWLGSVRLLSTPSRGTLPMMAYAPFGEGYAGGTLNDVEFTAGGYSFTLLYPENGSGSLQDFMFRRYSPTQGRWISPDPAGVGAVDPTSPQTWNRYAYVANVPTGAVDPLGLWTDVVGSSRRAGQGYGYDPFAFFPGRLSTIGGNWEMNSVSTTFGGETNTTFRWWFNTSPGAAFMGGSDGGAANNGTPQQPQNQQPSRLKDCAKAYYGFNTASGAAQDATRIALIPAAPIIPKAAVGLPQALGSGPLTNLLSYFSLGSGTAASGANIFRVAGRIGAPIAIASAVIDATAIGICASDYQGWLPHF